MNITRTSDLTGRTTTQNLPISWTQIIKWHNGMLIQEAFPQLNASQREFLMTGITDDEWDTLLPSEEQIEQEIRDYPTVYAMNRKGEQI